MKQTHNGQIIAGGDRIVTDCRAVPNAPINDQMNKRLKAFAEQQYPFLANLPIIDSWTGLMPFTKDGDPLIGKIDCVPGQVYIVTGL